MGRAKASVIDEVFIENSVFLLSRLGAESRHRFMEAVEPLGLSWQGQNVVTALHTLSKYGAVSQKQLADFIGIDPRNLVPIIDALERLTMLKRTLNPKDRRSHHVRLTARGEAMAKQTQEIRARLERDMLASLSLDEKERLHALLGKLWEHSDISQNFRVFPWSSHDEKNESST